MLNKNNMKAIATLIILILRCGCTAVTTRLLAWQLGGGQERSRNLTVFLGLRARARSSEAACGGVAVRIYITYWNVYWLWSTSTVTNAEASAAKDTTTVSGADGNWYV